MRRFLAGSSRSAQNSGMTTQPDTSALFVASLREILMRDLRSLEEQIAAYPDDESVWRTAPGISNPAGALALHLAGNLRHFFGAVLGSSGYQRDREAEFATRGVSRSELQELVRDTMSEVEQVLDTLQSGDLASKYPIQIADKSVGTLTFLMHLAVHFTWHLGQIDYHRRLLTADPKTVENVSIKALSAFGT